MASIDEVPEVHATAGDRETILNEPTVRLALSHAGVPIATFDTEGLISSANAPFAELFAKPLDSVVGSHLMSLCDTATAAHALAALVRVVGRQSDSEVVDLEIDQGPRRASTDVRLTFAAFTFPDGRLDKVMCVGSLAPQATPEVSFDLLGIDRLLGAALRRSGRTGYSFSLLTCRFDGLSDLEEGIGPLAADRAREICAARLEQRLRPSDRVCRSEDGEILVIAEALGDEQDAAGVAYRLLATMVDPVVVDGDKIDLPLTIGVAVADGAASAESVRLASQAALEAALADGGGGFSIIDIRPGLAA